MIFNQLMYKWNRQVTKSDTIKARGTVYLHMGKRTNLRIRNMHLLHDTKRTLEAKSPPTGASPEKYEEKKQDDAHINCVVAHQMQAQQKIIRNSERLSYSRFYNLRAESQQQVAEATLSRCRLTLKAEAQAQNSRRLAPAQEQTK